MMEICQVQSPLEEWVSMEPIISLTSDFNLDAGKQLESISTDGKDYIVGQHSKYELFDDLELLESGDNIDLSFLDFVDGNFSPQNDHNYMMPGDEGAISNSFLDSSYQSVCVDYGFFQQSDESILSSSPCSNISVMSDCSSDYDCIQGNMVSVSLPEELRDSALVDKVMDIYEKSKCDTQMWDSINYPKINPMSQYYVQHTPPYSPESSMSATCVLQVANPLLQKSDKETPPSSPENHLVSIQDTSATKKFDEHSLSLITFPHTKQNMIASEVALQVTSSYDLPTLKQVPKTESAASIAELQGIHCTSINEFPKQASSQLSSKQRKLKAPTLAEVKREGKKLSNRNAATRYRLKKRAEFETLKDEEDSLKQTNKELNEKIKQITTEMSYLRNLMKDMFRARGLIK